MTRRVKIKNPQVGPSRTSEQTPKICSSKQKHLELNSELPHGKRDEESRGEPKQSPGVRPKRECHPGHRDEGQNPKQLKEKPKPQIPLKPVPEET